MLAFIQVKKMILNCFGFIGSIIIHQFNTIHIHFTIVVASIRVECEIVLYSCTSLSSKLNCNGGRYITIYLTYCTRRHSVCDGPRVRLVVSHFRHLDTIRGGDERSQLFVYCSHGKLQP